MRAMVVERRVGLAVVLNGEQEEGPQAAESGCVPGGVMAVFFVVGGVVAVGFGSGMAFGGRRRRWMCVWCNRKTRSLYYEGFDQSR